MWPSLAETLPAFSKGKGLLTIGGCKNTMSGPADYACMQLKRMVVHNTMTNPSRSCTLHHIKMAVGLVDVLGGAPRDRDLEAYLGAEEGDTQPLCAWVYAGSHNLSGAAWGKVEEVKYGEGQEGGGAIVGYELVCM